MFSADSHLSGHKIRVPWVLPKPLCKEAALPVTSRLVKETLQMYSLETIQCDFSNAELFFLLT